MMEEEKKNHPAEEALPVSRPRIRSEYSHLFEDNDEDPYEQIFRRAEDQKDENPTGIPADKDQKVAGLFEEPEESEKSSVDDLPLKIPTGEAVPKTQVIYNRVSELLKKFSRKQKTAVPQEKSDTPDDAESVTVAEVQILPEVPEGQTNAVPEKEPVAADAVEKSAPEAEPVQKMPEQPEEIPADEPGAEPEDVIQPEEPEQKNLKSHTADTPKIIPAIEAGEETDDGEPVIVFAPIDPDVPEGVVLQSHTEEPPKGIPVVEAVEAEGDDGEPVIVFAPIGPKEPEPVNLMSHTEDIPVVVSDKDKHDDDEPVIVFAPDGPEESVNLMSHTEDTPEDIPVVEAVADDSDDDEPVIVFAPIAPKVPEAEEEPKVPEDIPSVRDESGEAGAVPEEPPAWNVKVEIPEEIKDVEGKLKVVTVEDLPIHIFTDAHPETPEPELPVPVPEPDVEPAAEAEKTEDVPPEEPPVVPAEPPQAEEQTEAEEQPAEPEPKEPPKPICVRWEEDTFRPYRGKEIRVVSRERLYAPVEKEYQRMVAPGRKKKQQEKRRKKRQEAYQQLKTAATEKAVQVRNGTVACAKKTAHSLHPKVVYGKVKHIAGCTAETGTYKISAMLQLIVAGLAGLLLLALLMVNKYNIPLQIELSQYRVPVLFAAIHAIAMGSVMLLSFRTTIGGTISLVTRKCDRGTDGVVSLLMWCCLTQSVLSVCFPDEIARGTASLYAPVCMLVLFMDAWGKLLNHRRVRCALAVLDGATGAECAGLLMEDTELQAQVDENVPDRLTVVRTSPADRDAFVRNAVSRDGSQKMMRMMTGPLLLAAVLVGVLEFSVSGSWMTALAAGTAVMCVSAPLSISMCMTVPVLRGGKRMHKSGAAIASWDAAVNFGETGCVVVRDEDLFPGPMVKLVNVKVIRERLLETSVVSAAAVLHGVGGPLRSVFDRILTGEVDAMPKAERVRPEENGGVVGWVNGVRIILGKGEHLQKYGIQPPSRDYENKNCPAGRQFVYLAAGHELVAMFVLEYRVDPEIRQKVQALSNLGCDLAVCTADANLHRAFLAESFDLEEDGVELLRNTTLPAQTDTEEDTRNQLIVQRGGVSLFAGLTTCIRMKGALELASALQFAGVLLGILLIVVFSATGTIYQLSNLVICLFELFWLTAVLGIPALRRM